MKNYTYLAIPTEILLRDDLNLADKVIYSMLLGFQANGDCWASNEYIANQCKVSIATVKRSLDCLETKLLIERKTQRVGDNIKKRFIKALTLKQVESVEQSVNEVRFKMNLREVQNEPHSGSKCTSPRFKMSLTEVQNEPILTNILTNNKLSEYEAPHSHTENFIKLKFLKLVNSDQDISSSNRFELENYPMLTLTTREARKVEELLEAANLSNKKQVELVLLNASAIVESSENKKAKLKSFTYIRSSIDDILKTRKNNKELELIQTRISGSTGVNRPERRVVRSS